MLKLNRTLIVVLVAQIALIALLASPLGGPAKATSEPLLGVDGAEVGKIVIHSAEPDATTRLSRRNGGWSVPLAEASYPASQAQVESLLESLADITLQWPVADSRAAAKRFEVAEQNFQRKLVLHHGGDKTALFLGTSPGYGQVHLRRAGESAVYSVALDKYSLAGQPAKWLDKSLMAAATDSATAFRSGDWSLTREGEQWQIGQRPDSAGAGALDRTAWQTYLSRWANLRIDSVLTPAEADKATAGEPARVFVFTRKSEPVRYQLYRTDKRAILTGSLQPGAFELASATADKLADLSGLIAKAKPRAGEAGKTAQSSN